MTELSQSIFNNHQVRKSNQQKSDFIQLIQNNISGVNIEESTSLVKSRNIVVGDVENADIILTAHYDTPAVLPFPNFLAPKNILANILYQGGLAVIIATIIFTLQHLYFEIMPDNLFTALSSLVLVYILLALMIFYIIKGKANKNNANDNTSGVITLIEIMNKLTEEEKQKAAFVFFDNEELGTLGSMAFKQKHKEKMKNTLLVNFDCVSDGDHIMIIKNKKAHLKYADLLDSIMVSADDKNIVQDRAIRAFYPSDQMNFPINIGVAAFRKNILLGYYVSRIHTAKDTVFDERNIVLLSDKFSDLIKKISTP